MKDGGNDVGSVALTSGSVGGAATSAGTLLGWLNANIALLSLSLTVISILIGVYFSVQTHRWRKRQEQRDIEKMRAQIIAELKNSEQTK